MLLVGAVCGLVGAAPQGTSSSSSSNKPASSSSSSNKPDKRFFGVQGGGFGVPGSFQGGFNPALPGGFNPAIAGGLNPAIAGGFQGGFPGGVGVGGITPIPPNIPVNVVNPGTGAVVGTPIQQCARFCRQPNGQYGCCNSAAESHPGECPVPRPSCPPVRNFGVGPQACNIDIDCPFPNKCCWDTCLTQKVCKAANQFVGNVFG